MLKLDKKDVLLLYELSRDARMSHTQLGKKIKLSKSSVKYRIDRLKEHGVIDQFTAIIDFRSLGVDSAVLLVRFNGQLNEEMKAFFRTNAYVDWAITLSGHWDILAEVAFRSLKELHIIIATMLQTFSEKIRNYELVFLSKQLRVEHLVKDFYKDLNITTPERDQRATEKTELDSTDRSILRQITLDSETSTLDIARTIGKTIDTVSARLKRLLDSKVIIKYFTEINLSKLGYTEYLYMIKFNNLNQDRISALANEIKQNDNVKYAFLDITETRIVLNFACKETKTVDEFTSEIRKNYDDIIETQEYYLIKEQLKFDLCPQALLLEQSAAK